MNRTTRHSLRGGNRDAVQSWFGPVAAIAILVASCSKEPIRPIELSADQVSDDFALSAYLSNGYRIRGYPVEGTNGATFTGPVMVLSPKGQLAAEGFVRAGSLSGPLATFWDDGGLSTLEFYKSGRIHGVGIVVDPTGQLASSTEYQKGRKAGFETYWGTNGLPEKQIEWVDGKVVSIRLYERGGIATNLVGQAAQAFFRRLAAPQMVP